MDSINPHLTLSTYGQLKPGDRVVHVRPTRADAHLVARPVREIVRTYRTRGYTPNWALPRHKRTFRPWDPWAYTHFAHEFIVWRNDNGSLFDDLTDEPVWIVPADQTTS